MSRKELDYPKWKTHRLAGRLRTYVGYVGCACSHDEHDPKSTGCARADVARLVRELSKRVRP
jgi:hypothetical protein